MEEVEEAQILKYIGELIWNTLILIRLANCRVVLYLLAVCVLSTRNTTCFVGLKINKVILLFYKLIRLTYL